MPSSRAFTLPKGDISWGCAYWATKPDPLFTKIVDAALSLGRDLACTWEGSSSTDWARMYPELARFFSPATCKRELEKLRVAHGSRKVFRPGDYQWLLLCEILRDFCEAYNDQPIDAIEHEGTLIRHIDFDAILEIFFWDLDFTIPLEELETLGVGGRDMMGIHEQAFNSAAGFVPHPDELALEEMTSPEWAEEDEAFFRTGCKTYPAPLRVPGPGLARSRGMEATTIVFLVFIIVSWCLPFQAAIQLKKLWTKT